MRRTGRGPKTVYWYELLSVSELIFAGITLFLATTLLLVFVGGFAGVVFAMFKPDRAIPFGRGTAIVVLMIGFFAPAIDYIRKNRHRIGTTVRLFAVVLGCILLPLIFMLVISLWTLPFDDLRPGNYWITTLVAVSPGVPLIVVWSGYRIARGPIVIREKGQCHACGYNLRGTISSVCPECGTPRLATPLEK